VSIFKINFMSAPLVRHVYCQLFVADGPDMTWALCGNLTMRKSEFADFQAIVSPLQFEDVTPSGAKAAASGDLMKEGDGALSPRLIHDGEPPTPIAWPSPTEEMMTTAEFEAVWQCIKKWDINVPDAYAGYCGATGNHVRAILDGLRKLKEE
jgi:hypothetical protein